MKTVNTFRPRKIDEFKTLGMIAALKDFPVLQARYEELVKNGWIVYVVNQNRGMCNYTHKCITVPLWAIDKGKGHGYWVYYIAHEFSHTDTFTHYEQSHGPKFQARLKELCPIEYIHYELGYKAVQASKAGITREHASKAIKVDIVDILDLL